MIKNIMVTAIMVTIAVCQPTFGQHKQHTLGELWPEVEAHYPGVGAHRSAVEAAVFNERAVKSTMLPQLRAQAQNTYGTFNASPGGFFPQAGFFNVSGVGAETDPDATTASTFASATLEWEVFSFGRLQKQIDAAGALSARAVSDQDVYLLELKQNLSERYINLLYHDAKLRWADYNARRLDTIRKITAGLSEAGLRPAADSLLASSSYVQALGEYDKREGQKKAALHRLLELYPGQDLNFQASAQRFIEPVDDYPQKGGALADGHPALEALDQQARYYALSGQAQRRSSLPSLRLLGGYSVRGSGIDAQGVVSDRWQDGFSNTHNNVLAGVGLTWDLTGLHRNRLRGEKMEREAESAEYRRSQYEQGMQADLAASQAEITQQYSQLKKTRLAVDHSRQAYYMYLSRYQSGLITLSELLQIRLLLEQAEIRHIEASRQYWLLLAYRSQLTADFSFLFNNL